MEIGERLEAESPEDFGDWLATNGASAREIWVVLYKKASGKQRVTYEQLIEVGLCHGWIDGTRKGIDAERFAQRFSPRRKGGNWTEKNLQIARRLIAEGRMTEAGWAALPDAGRAE